MSFVKQLQQASSSTQAKLWITLLTSLYLVIFLVIHDGINDVTDPIHTLHTLEPSLQRTSSLVSVGLHINNLPVFSISKNTFTIDGIVWFRFPIGTESLDTISRFEIQNVVRSQGGDLLYKSEPIIKLVGDEVIASYHIQATIKTALDYKDFPIASHRLNVIITNKSVTARELYFTSKPEQFTLGQHTLVYSWTMRDQTVVTGYEQAPLSSKEEGLSITYPAACFSVIVDNIGVRDLISLYFPMFVLFLIALFCLLIDISDTARLGYVAAAVPILVLFRMVIDGVSPDVGKLTHLDYMYNLFVFLSLVILFFQTYVVLRLQNLKKKSESVQDAPRKHLQLWNNAMFFCILIALAIGTTCSFLR